MVALGAGAAAVPANAAPVPKPTRSTTAVSLAQAVVTQVSFVVDETRATLPFVADRLTVALLASGVGRFETVVAPVCEAAWTR